MTNQITITSVASRLRAIRQSKSLSLSDVEDLSQGSLKAVVLGSYERGARTLSVKRAIAIADLYQIPVSELFTDQKPIELVTAGKTVIDLRAINMRAHDPSHPSHIHYQLLARVAQRIVRSRQDWNGEVLSLRQSDLETIGILFDQPISTVLNWLEDERILLKKRGG